MNIIKEKFLLCKKIYKQEGVKILLKLIWCSICLKFCKYIIYPLNKPKYKMQLISLLNSSYKRIIIWKGNFGWDVTLFQRPQHIAKAFSDKNVLVLYEVSLKTDSKVHSISKLKDNLYLINRDNLSFQSILYSLLKNVNKPKYIQVYSTELELNVEELKSYEKKGFSILYEYIDDISPDISVTKSIPKNVIDKYDYIMSNPKIPLVVTADRLFKDAVFKRGYQNLVLSSNGVDIDHFNHIPDGNFNNVFQQILYQNKIIIGYYGALAKWLDLSLLKTIVTLRTDIVFVLIGKIYDQSINYSILNELKQIYYIGEIPYDDLPRYANQFHICMIPFVINDLTNATSPLKLFEYMALGKPIITTDMEECRKYKSVLVAKNVQDFNKKIDEAILISKNKDQNYFDILRKEAYENTWDKKADKILSMLYSYETTMISESVRINE